MMLTTPWILVGRRFIGLHEIPGAPTEPVIAGWLKALRAWWVDDATPWCGTFAAHCMQEVGVSLPAHWYRAKGWLDWGVPLTAPAVGCVVVFEREGGGHVGFVTGRTPAGALVVLGGNQGDAVNERPFDVARVAGYRWPSPATFDPVVGFSQLPVISGAGALSEREA